jgi:tRNA 5-methylaminomethyl-2-thiouridine biosynthesis bifunctional protein
VVGGCIAGCHIAYALAKRGLKVTLIEKGDQLANAASSNHRAVLYTRISPHQDALSRFNLAALLFACRFYENGNFFLSSGDQCGVLHLVRNQREKDLFNDLSEMFESHPEILTELTPEKCSELAGNKIQKNGIFFSKAGWLNPVSLCKELCSHPNIKVLTNLEVSSFSRPGSNWEVETDGQLTLNSELLILANAKDLTHFQQSEHLQLKNIRGQVSYLSELPASIMQPSTVICAEGYIAPLDNCGVCIGASFNLNSSDEDISKTDHSDNLQRMSEIFPDYAEHIQSINIAALQGNVGFRCTTPDYFPVVGPLPITEQIATRFSVLRKRAKAQVDACGVYHPNLFCLTGLGSRGLAYAPLAADALASSILGEPLPINSDLWLHLHPARFIIRNLIRNQSIPGLNSV